MAFQLTKHHGLENDFLVMLGSSEVIAQVGPERAVQWCARHTGLGADGLLLGSTDLSEVDLRMVLYNADGSRAEMSGNGIRCLAQAEMMRRGETAATLRIETDGGLRHVEVASSADPALVSASVNMGRAALGPVPDREPEALNKLDLNSALAAQPLNSLTVDLGNPHLVLQVDDPAKVDLAQAGPRWEAGFDDGINVHVVAVTEQGQLRVETWERGAGLTMACGTGAAAAAFAANQWGLVPTELIVSMPGGAVRIELGDEIMLHGPSVHIANLEVPE